mmetsp:Transcript_11776/g.19346  ORF Transcript_11776/g.19346 Transcript_11776/m.19346 type:complete len:151 (+) Transcript_11776:77-529(+)
MKCRMTNVKLRSKGDRSIPDAQPNRYVPRQLTLSPAHHRVAKARMPKKMIGMLIRKTKGLHTSHRIGPISAMYITRTSMMNHQTLMRITSGFCILCRKTSKKPLLFLFFFLGGSGGIISGIACIAASCAHPARYVHYFDRAPWPAFEPGP